MDLNGKVALITGGAKRVGRAVALALAREGADVALHYNHSAGDARDAADRIRRLGRRAELFQADLADPPRIRALFEALAGEFDRLDVLVNNAAVFGRTPLATLTAEQWDGQLAVNARAAALCIRYAAGLMCPAGGAIVNITDSGAEKGWAGYPAYCASKAALAALTKSSAKALAGDNIRVNAVAPGAVQWAEGQTEEQKAAVLMQIPMRRIGSPDDVAEAVLMLCRSDYVTAQTIRVDGGWHMG